MFGGVVALRSIQFTCVYLATKVRAMWWWCAHCCSPLCTALTSCQHNSCIAFAHCGTHYGPMIHCAPRRCRWWTACRPWRCCATSWAASTRCRSRAARPTRYVPIRPGCLTDGLWQTVVTTITAGVMCLVRAGCALPASCQSSVTHLVVQMEAKCLEGLKWRLGPYFDHHDLSEEQWPVEAA